MAEKRYYWLKIKEDFLNGEIVDFFMSQPNGANYVVLYQMLIMKAINTNGELYSKIGEVIVPFTLEKIQRECKYFELDTVRVAMELYAKLGLVYKNENGMLQITNFEEYVGVETKWAVKKRLYREKVADNVLKNRGQCPQNVQDNVLPNVRQDIDIRDKILDKDIDIEKEIDKDNKKEKGNSETSSLPPLEKKSKKEQYIELVQTSTLSTKIQEQILEWLEYKKWKYTEVGIKSLLTIVAKNVDKYEESAVCAVIVESMGNMWQGICWDKLGRKEILREEKEEAEYIEDGEYLIFKKIGARIHKETYAAWSRKDN